MDACGLFCGGNCRGEVTFLDRGACTEVRAGMEDPGDGLYRAFLLGPHGERLLGVLEPGGCGRLGICRRLYSRDLAALGQPLRGEARRSFPFRQESRWRETETPRELFRGEFLRSRLRGVRRAWWRREGERLYLALPLEEGRPFPLESLFCLAKVEPVEGRTCAVYAFLGEEPAAE